MFISAQVSIYPLRQSHLAPAIDRTLEGFRRRGLEVTTGAMSTVIAGDDETLFTALKEAFQQGTAESELVMTVTLSNACPVRPPG